MTKLENIEKNRRKYVEALRTTDRKQCFGCLWDPGGEVCAIGLAAQVLCGYAEGERQISEVYADVRGALGMPMSKETTITRLNDRQKLTFREIGDILAAEWGLE